MLFRFAFGLVLALAWGCSFVPLDLSEHDCPCAIGYSCTPSGCVLGPGSDASADAAVADRPVTDQSVTDLQHDTPLMETGMPSDAGDIREQDVSDPGPSRCDADWFLCENFDEPLEGYEESFPAPERDLGRVHRGSASLRVDVVDDGLSFIGKSLGGASTATSDLHVRYFAYFPEGADVDYVGVVQLISGFRNHLTQAVSNNLARLEVRTLGADFFEEGPLMPRDQWNCVTFSVHVGETEGSVSMSVNADLAITYDFETGTNFPPLVGATLGFVRQLRPTPDYAFWIDSFAIAGTPIRCED